MASLEYSPVCQSRNGRAVRMRCRYWCCLLVTNHQVLLLKSEFHARCWRVLFVVVNVQPADGAALPLQRHNGRPGFHVVLFRKGHAAAAATGGAALHQVHGASGVLSTKPLGQWQPSH